MTEFAKLYGGSLYDLAAEEGLDERILGELDETVSLLAANPDYLRLLAKERCALLDEALQGAVHPYLLNFLKLLCEQGAVRELTGCARAYHLRFNQAHGVLEATAVSAVALSEAQADQLKQKLETATGKRIDLVTKVDPAVLGGIRLEMDGTLLDGTVQNRLASLRSRIAEATL